MAYGMRSDLGRGLSNIANLIVGNPQAEAESEAAIQLMRQRAAAADLDRQTQQYRSGATEALQAGDLNMALAQLATLGSDANFESVTGIQALNGAPEAEQGILQAATGVQTAPNTFLGQGRNLASLEARNNSDNARALEVAAMKPVEAMVDGQPALVRTDEAPGLSPIVKAAIGEGATPTGFTSNQRLQLQAALEPYTNDLERIDPNLPAQVAAEVIALMENDVPFPEAVNSVIGRIEIEEEVKNPSGTWLSRALGMNTSPDITGPVDGARYRLAPPSTPDDAGEILRQAREAVAQGANPQAVRQRLLDMGIDPGPL